MHHKFLKNQKTAATATFLLGAHTALCQCNYITSDWSLAASVRETKPEKQFWTVLWLKCIHLARADVVHRRTEQRIKTASPSVLLVDENQIDLTMWKL